MQKNDGVSVCLCRTQAPSAQDNAVSRSDFDIREAGVEPRCESTSLQRIVCRKNTTLGMERISGCEDSACDADGKPDSNEGSAKPERCMDSFHSRMVRGTSQSCSATGHLTVRLRVRPMAGDFAYQNFEISHAVRLLSLQRAHFPNFAGCLLGRGNSGMRTQPR